MKKLGKVCKWCKEEPVAPFTDGECDRCFSLRFRIERDKKLAIKILEKLTRPPKTTGET